MKYRHAVILLCISVPMCVLLRSLQLIFTIDSTTGFIKQRYYAISMLITVIVCAAIATVSMLATAVDGIRKSTAGPKPVVALASILVGGMFVFQTVTGIVTQSDGFLQDKLLVILSLVLALVFFAYGLKNVFQYDMPNIILIAPSLYYIVKLISVFVSTAKLALVTENVFLIFTNSVLLWFMFEFAGYENQMGETDKKPKRLFASGLAAFMLCTVTSLPKIIAALYDGASLSRSLIAEALLNMAVGIFVVVYIGSNFCKSEKIQKISKHSA